MLICSSCKHSFIYYSFFHPIFLKSLYLFTFWLVRCWIFKDKKERDGPCKGLEHSGEMLGPRKAVVAGRQLGHAGRRGGGQQAAENPSLLEGVFLAGHWAWESSAVPSCSSTRAEAQLRELGEAEEKTGTPRRHDWVGAVSGLGRGHLRGTQIKGALLTHMKWQVRPNSKSQPDMLARGACM